MFEAANLDDSSRSPHNATSEMRTVNKTCLCVKMGNIAIEPSYLSFEAIWMVLKRILTAAIHHTQLVCASHTWSVCCCHCEMNCCFPTPFWHSKGCYTCCKKWKISQGYKSKKNHVILFSRPWFGSSRSLFIWAEPCLSGARELLCHLEWAGIIVFLAVNIEQDWIVLLKNWWREILKKLQQRGRNMTVINNIVAESPKLMMHLEYWRASCK